MGVVWGDPTIHHSSHMKHSIGVKEVEGIAYLFGCLFLESIIILVEQARLALLPALRGRHDDELKYTLTV